MLASLINFFVHPSLQGDADRLLRVRILIAVLLTLVVQESTVFIVLALRFPLNAVVFGGSLTVLSVLTSAALLVALRRNASYVFCSLAAPLITQLLIIAGIVVSGGLSDSPVTQLLVAPVLMGFFLGGIRRGIYIVVFTLLAAAVFIALEMRGIYGLHTIEPGAQMNHTRLLISAINFSFICGMTLAYEYTAMGLRRERDREHENSVRLAKIDPLTTLPNRRNFDAMLEERVHNSGRQQFVLGALDLNGFKLINDEYGHSVGDEVLCIVSERIRAALRESEFVGRYGGDEFMLILDGHSNSSNLEALARRLLDAIEAPINSSRGMVQVGASIGFAMFSQYGADTDALKQAADIAMYEAKRAGSGWCVHCAELKRA